MVKITNTLSAVSPMISFFGGYEWSPYIVQSASSKQEYAIGPSTNMKIQDPGSQIEYTLLGNGLQLGARRVTGTNSTRALLWIEGYEEMPFDIFDHSSAGDDNSYPYDINSYHRSELNISTVDTILVESLSLEVDVLSEVTSPDDLVKETFYFRNGTDARPSPQKDAVLNPRIIWSGDWTVKDVLTSTDVSDLNPPVYGLAAVNAGGSMAFAVPANTSFIRLFGGAHNKGGDFQLDFSPTPPDKQTLTRNTFNAFWNEDQPILMFDMYYSRLDPTLLYNFTVKAVAGVLHLHSIETTSYYSAENQSKVLPLDDINGGVLRPINMSSLMDWSGPTGTSSPTSTQRYNSPDNSVSTGIKILAGSIVGGVVAFAIIVLLGIWMILRHRRRHKQTTYAVDLGPGSSHSMEELVEVHPYQPAESSNLMSEYGTPADSTRLSRYHSYHDLEPSRDSSDSHLQQQQLLHFSSKAGLLQAPRHSHRIEVEEDSGAFPDSSSEGVVETVERLPPTYRPEWSNQPELPAGASRH